MLPVGLLIASFGAFPVDFKGSNPVSYTLALMQSTLSDSLAWKTENRVFILIIIIFVVFSLSCTKISAEGKFSQFSDAKANESKIKQTQLRASLKESKPSYLNCFETCLID